MGSQPLRAGILAFACAAQLLVLPAPAAASLPLIHTVAGSDTSTLGDGGPATSAGLDHPSSATWLPSGTPPYLDTIIADGGYAAIHAGHCVVRKVDGVTGVISTIAGTPGNCTGAVHSGDNATQSSLANPCCIARTSQDGLLISQRRNVAGLVDYEKGGVLTTLLGTSNTSCSLSLSDGSDPLADTPCGVTGLAAHPTTEKRFLVAFEGYRTYEVTAPPNPTVMTVEGGCGSGAQPLAFQKCFQPGAVAYVTDTVFLVADPSHGKVWKFDTSDSSVAVQVASGLTTPTGLALAYDGGLYVSESNPPTDCRVQHVSDLSGTGTVTTVAGTGSCAAAGRLDGVQADQSSLVAPLGLAMSPEGLLVTEELGDVTDAFPPDGRGRVRLVDRISVLSAPPGFTSASQAVITFASLDPVDCTLYTPAGPIGIGGCTSPQSFGGSDGESYGFQINAPFGGSAPLDPTAPYFGWTFDRTVPSAFSLVSPEDGAVGLSPSPTFSWGASSDANLDHYDLLIDDQVSRNAGTKTEATPGAPLAEGLHTWQVRAVDKAGNSTTSSAKRTFTSAEPPTASFSMAPNPVLVGRPVTFDGSVSSDTQGPIARWRWDLDGDGSFETDTGTSPTASRSYSSPGPVNVTLEVTDGAGGTATKTQVLQVTSAQTIGTQFGVTINNGAQYTRDPNVVVTANFPPTVTSMLFSNDGGFLAPQTFAPQKQTNWRLDSSGPERLPKIVYVRFLTGPLVSETHTDDIILDEIPPKVEQASILPSSGTTGSATAAATRLRTWRVKVKATDSNSGVAAVQVTANKRKPGKLIPYRPKLKVRSSARPKFVRAQDRAGNFSPWRKAAKR